MANAALLKKSNPVRMLVVGNPKAGKTGSLVSLLNAGFKIRFLDFDGNIEPLLNFANPAMLGNLDVLSFEDDVDLSPNGQMTEVRGVPQAFANALKAMQHWKYKDETGAEVDLGRSKDWGLDTIVVLDSLTAMGHAAFARAIKLLNKTPLTITDRVWGLGMSEQMSFVKRLMSTGNSHHTIVLAHLKMIGPKEIRKGDDGITQQAKQELAALIETRLYPRALGRELPQEVGGEFPIIVEVSTEVVNGKEKRVIKTMPRAELDLGVPMKDIPPKLDLSDGMLKLFEVLSPESVKLVRGANT